MKEFILIGENVELSRAVLVHHEFMKNKKGKYSLLSIPKGNFDNAIQFIFEKYDGVNLTTPYKERVIKFLDEMDDTAKACGAVNAVKITGKKKIGYNTDVTGFEKTVDVNGLDFSNKKILLCGAGGEAKAIAYAISKSNKNIDILNRTYDRASELKLRFDLNGNIYSDINMIDCQYDVIINATPLGRGDLYELSPVNDRILEGVSCIIDANYYPTNRKIAKQAKAKDIPIINGAEPLIYQAIAAQKIWWDTDKIDVDFTKVLQLIKDN